LQWPTLLTLVMFPILLVMYVRLAITEEKEMRRKFGTEYEAYAAHTPRFMPSLRTKLLGTDGGAT
jgi:protein-S-isoprenylcysteine O-methyltransferase Ste14